jgi:glycerophosphoryl diester phosphodiesterase
MIVSPEGRVLANMGGKFGMICAELDPTKKYLKAAGFGNPPAPHHEYIEYGRKPWLYRNAGPSVGLNDSQMPYPRVCAHRGFNTIAPENSMPALGAAVAMGADEIEFDLWPTTDGVLVSSHDSTLDRVSDGHGKIYEHSYAELLELDFGGKYSEKLKGLKIPTFEEILQKFAGRVIMNIHVKLWDKNFPEPMMEKIVGLVRKYDAQKYVYFMTTNDKIIRQLMEYAPDIHVCVGWDGNKDPMSMVDRAIAMGAYKVQLFKPYFNADTIKKAHEHGILCNVFWSDDPEETKKFLDMGIDTILTNDYHLISQIVKDR